MQRFSARSTTTCPLVRGGASSGAGARKSTRCRASEDGPKELVEDSPVPKAQQPIFELQQIRTDMIMEWAERPLPEFLFRLLSVYAGFFAFIGVPVSAATFNFATEPVPFIAAASIGSCFVVVVMLLRIYLGWSYVGNRLLSATIEYEETGWYDGQVWVKSRQALTRDRLLNNYTVLPAMRRIRRSLLCASAACLVSVAAVMIGPKAEATESAMPAYRTSSWVIPGDESEYNESAVLAYESFDDDMEEAPAAVVMGDCMLPPSTVYSE